MCMSTYMVSKKILNPLTNKGTSKLTNLHSFRVFTCDCKMNTKLVYLGMNSQMIYYWIVTLNSNMKWEHRSFMGENKITHLHDNWHRLDISQQHKGPSTLNPILEIYHPLFQMSTTKLTDCYTQRAWLGEYDK